MRRTTATLGIGLAFLLAAPSLARAAGAATPTPAAKRKLEPIYDPDIIGKKALEAAAEAAHRTGRRLFVNFGTNDCDTCRAVNDVMHEPAFIEAFLRQFVPVFIDVTPGGPNEELFKAYGIDRKKGLPGAAIFDSNATPMEITKDGELAAAARKGRDAIMDWFLRRFAREE